MSVLWNIPQRQVFLRGNQLAAADATTLRANYVLANIGQTELGDRAIEFPFEANNDAILNAGDIIVGLIGSDPQSPFRTSFAGVTANLATGALIPLVSSVSVPIVGKVGDVLDASTNRKMKFADYHIIEGYNTLKTNILKVQPYLFFTDNVRIWHTVANVVADVVIWSKTTQTGLMESNPRGICPFPENLIPLLVDGALARLFRGSFNAQQAPEYYRRWVSGLQAAFPNATEDTAARVIAE